MSKEYPITNLPVDLLIEDEGDRFWDIHEVHDFQLKEEASGKQHPFDLQERTLIFAENIVRFAKTIPHSPVNDRLIDQLVGAGTSIGANYCEADEGLSEKDFKKHIGICRKEAKETKYFLRLLAVAEEHRKPEARILWREARELHLIFCAIYRKC